MKMELNKVKNISFEIKQLETFYKKLLDVIYPKQEIPDYYSIKSIISERCETIKKQSEMAQLEIGLNKTLLKVKDRILRMFRGVKEKELYNYISFLGWWGATPITLEDLVNISVINLKKRLLLIIIGYLVGIVVFILFGWLFGLLLIGIWTFIVRLIVFSPIFTNINFFKGYYERLRDEDTLFAPTVIAPLLEPSIPLAIKKMASGICGSISHEVRSFAGLSNAKELFCYWSATHPVNGLRFLEGIVSDENEFKNIVSKLKSCEIMMKTISEELKNLFVRMSAEMRDKLSVGGTATIYLPLMLPLFFGLIGMGDSPLLALQIPIVWMMMLGFKKSLINSEARYLIPIDKFEEEKNIALTLCRKYFIILFIVGTILFYITCNTSTLVNQIFILFAAFFFALAIIIIFAGILVDRKPYIKPTEYLKMVVRFCSLLKNPPKRLDEDVTFKGVDGEYNIAVQVAGLHSDFPDDIKKILVGSGIKGNAEERIMLASKKLPPLAKPFLEGVIPILKMDKKVHGGKLIRRSDILNQYIATLGEVLNAAITWETMEAYLLKRTKWISIMLGVMMGVIVVVGSMLQGILQLLFEGLAMNLAAIFKGLAIVFQNLGNVLPSMAIFCGLGVAIGITSLCYEDRLQNIVYGLGGYIVSLIVLSLIFKLTVSFLGDVGSVFQDLSTTNINFFQFGGGF